MVKCWGVRNGFSLLRDDFGQRLPSSVDISSTVIRYFENMLGPQLVEDRDLIVEISEIVNFTWPKGVMRCYVNRLLIKMKFTLCCS